MIINTQKFDNYSDLSITQILGQLLLISEMYTDI